MSSSSRLFRFVMRRSCVLTRSNILILDPGLSMTCTRRRRLVSLTLDRGRLHRIEDGADTVPAAMPEPPCGYQRNVAAICAPLMLKSWIRLLDLLV